MKLRTKLIAVVYCFFFTQAAVASLITNGDFETGDLSGWTTFTTTNGTIGTPAVVPFNTNSARFES